VPLPVVPTSTADFPLIDAIGPFRSLVPGRAALKLFDQSVKLDLTGRHHHPRALRGGSSATATIC
jgi:hypothetical protein